MKRTQLIELLHTIRKTWVSFFSIVLFVAAGSCIFLGIHWSSASLGTAVVRVYEQDNFHNYDISFPYGITDDDFRDILSVEGVTRAEGAYTAFETFQLGGKGRVMRIQSVTEDIDKSVIVEGEMPTGSDELALDSYFAIQQGIKVGDKITLDSDGDDEDGMKYLNSRTFTVTGLVKQAGYISTAKSSRGVTTLSVGVADCFAVAPKAVFDADAYGGCYSNVLVCTDAAHGVSTFSSRYSTLLGGITERLEAVGSEDAPARYQAVRAAAQEKIDDGQKQIDDGGAQVAAAEQQISDGEALIASTEQQISDGEAQIAAGEQQVADGAPAGRRRPGLGR